MAFWNYIGEFFLFRWLLGLDEHDEAKHDAKDTTNIFGNRCEDEIDSHVGFGRHYGSQYHGYSQSYNHFHDEQDDYDMMDDDF